MDSGYPKAPVEAGHVELAARRVRGVLDNTTVFDTIRARYVWEWPFYPQYYVPAGDVAAGVLVSEDESKQTPRGTAQRHSLRAGNRCVPAAAWVYGSDAIDGVAGTVQFAWEALDAWYEEDERVFVHPRNPYTRVDALRSSRRVRVELAGVVLAESSAPVLVFETGLPTRYYLDPSCVAFEHLLPSDTETPCPYKGRTSRYWSVRIDGATHSDLAWSYDYPTAELRPIAGLIAFYDEKVDVILDGIAQPRPTTHFG